MGKTRTNFKTKPLNPVLLTAEDTDDFIPAIRHIKFRHGKPVGKRELSGKMFRTHVYQPNARPHRFHETNLVPPIPPNCACGCKERRRYQRARREDFANTIADGYRFWAGN
ncbi:hypothetical protein F4825DRAFT_446227 [Nemania diffusa]|nr:hypothetical protein F4825DRAFT_446227 [Nemania diffusa]